MLPPSGDQFEISGGGYRAVVTESGAALRLLEYAGRPLLDGFAEDEMSSGGRGQVLMPWPNRIRDGAYSFGGADHQLALTEPKRHNASHGLARWAAWSLEEHTANSVSLGYRLMAQTGYPWTVDLHVLYDLSADGLTVTQTASNLTGTPAPYASGAHPYLVVGSGPVDRLRADPAGVHAAARRRRAAAARRSRGRHGDAVRLPGRPAGPRHRVQQRVHRPRARRGGHRDDRAARAVHGARRGALGGRPAPWVLVYSADDVPATARRSLAVEPMTAPADAFRSGEDLVTLAPEGEPGDEHSVSWGVRALD